MCERCGQREAAVHLKESVNGELRELHLCAHCAHELGYDVVFGSFNPFAGIGIQDILGSLFSQAATQPAIADGKKCSFCGMTFGELARTAKAGCAHCYSEFYRELLPSIQRIHGKTQHVGKVPRSAGEAVALRRRIDTLKKELNDAVAAQEYEKAATLRDQIRACEKKVQGK